MVCTVNLTISKHPAEFGFRVLIGFDAFHQFLYFGHVVASLDGQNISQCRGIGHRSDTGEHKFLGLLTLDIDLATAVAPLFPATVNLDASPRHCLEIMAATTTTENRSQNVRSGLWWLTASRRVQDGTNSFVRIDTEVNSEVEFIDRRPHGFADHFSLVLPQASRPRAPEDLADYVCVPLSATRHGRDASLIPVLGDGVQRSTSEHVRCRFLNQFGLRGPDGDSISFVGHRGTVGIFEGRFKSKSPASPSVSTSLSQLQFFVSDTLPDQFPLVLVCLRHDARGQSTLR